MPVDELYIYIYIYISNLIIFSTNERWIYKLITKRWIKSLFPLVLHLSINKHSYRFFVIKYQIILLKLYFSYKKKSCPKKTITRQTIKCKGSINPMNIMHP